MSEEEYVLLHHFIPPLNCWKEHHFFVINTEVFCLQWNAFEIPSLWFIFFPICYFIFTTWDFTVIFSVMILTTSSSLWAQRLIHLIPYLFIAAFNFLTHFPEKFLIKQLIFHSSAYTDFRDHFSELLWDTLLSNLLEPGCIK